MQQAKAGYTLLEILVVLVIISIASAMAVLTIGHNHNKDLENLSKELVQTLTLAEEQALLQPSTLGLVFNPTSFRFYEYHQEKQASSWQELSDHALGSHTIPAGVQLRIKVAGKELISNPEETLKPSLLIFNNGNMTPFSIVIAEKDQKPRYEIIGRSDGSISSHRYVE